MKKENTVFNYLKWGQGPKALVTFHGFGQNSAYYKSLAENVQNSFTVYSFDLPFHGESTWPQGDIPISKEDLGTIIAEFLKKQGIESFSIVGFSLGAKFAISVYELFASRVPELILIAPEGIKINTWYKIATGNYLIRRVFRFIIGHPGLLFWLTRSAKLTGLINPKVASFSLKQMESKENRLRIYHSWVVFRKLRVRISDLTDLIRTHGTRVKIYIGSLDKVITRQAAEPLIKNVPEYVEVKVIESDHSRLLEAFAKDFNHD